MDAQKVPSANAARRAKRGTCQVSIYLSIHMVILLYRNIFTK